MEPIKFGVTLAHEVIVARVGLPLMGRLPSRTQLHERIDWLTAAVSANPPIGHGDVTLSMTGSRCLERPDDAAIEDEAPMDLLLPSMGLSARPSVEKLRQRLDQIGAPCLNDALTIAQDESTALLGGGLGWAADGVLGGRPGDVMRRWVALDIDVSPFDTGNTKKQGVSRTPKGVDGYVPISAYLGEAGYLVNAELRGASPYRQRNAVAFIIRSLDLPRSVLEIEQPLFCK